MTFRAQAAAPVLQLIQLVQERQVGREVSVEVVLERWTGCWDALVSLERRRVAAVALLALLGPPHPKLQPPHPTPNTLHPAS